MKEIMTGKLGAGADDPTNRSGLRQPPQGNEEPDVDEREVSDDEDMQTFMKQMEAELRGTGVLDLGSSSSKRAASNRAVIKGPKQEDDSDGDEVYELSSDDDIDNEIDINLAKNLLESLKSQAGMAGPGGNLMGLMGLGMPRDELDDDEDDGQPGPSGTRRGVDTNSSTGKIQGPPK